jgi:hypothetical protein
MTYTIRVEFMWHDLASDGGMWLQLWKWNYEILYAIDDFLRTRSFCGVHKRD